MKRRLWATLATSLILLGTALPALAAADEAPDALIQRLAAEVVGSARDQALDTNRIMALIDSLPNAWHKVSTSNVQTYLQLPDLGQLEGGANQSLPCEIRGAGVRNRGVRHGGESTSFPAVSSPIHHFLEALPRCACSCWALVCRALRAHTISCSDLM